MPGITKSTMFGFDGMQWSHRSTSGYITGAANLTASNTGTSSNMARHLGAVSCNFAFPAPNIVSNLGDDGIIGSYQFGPQEPNSADFESSVFDAAFYQAVTGIASVTRGDQEITALANRGVVAVGMCIALQRVLLSQTAGQVGAKGYETTILPNVDVHYVGGGSYATAAAQNNVRYQFVINDTDTMPNGISVATAIPTAPGGRLSAYLVRTDYRYSMAAFVGDNSVDDITVTYKPVSVAKSKATIETTGFADDTVSAIVTTSPYQITLDGAPGSGKFAIADYEFVSW